ncbi:MAG: hypothetical protein AAF718_09150 [Pseudomonadota bacterium]
MFVTPSQVRLNDLWAENCEVTSVERSRDEARAMVADYADHWAIDASDVPPEQWSEIASAPDPLEVVPNIDDPRFADPVPAREAVELDPWVEGFTPAEPLPPNGGFTRVPTPPFIEEFPAGDGLDLPNHTGVAVPVVETGPLVTLPPEAIGPDVVTMAGTRPDGEPYRRPGLRVGIRQDILDAAPQTPDGRYINPHDGMPI